MYHPPSKKRQLFIRVLVSISTSAAVLLLVVFLVLYMLGYRFAGGGGRIEQSGLMQYVTVPNGATIEVDGSALSTKSPTKSSVFPGKHEFVMWRDDYETWRKTETVQAGTLMWLNYTRLVPKVRTVEPVASLPKAAVSLTSPESRYMAVLPDAQTPTIDFYNLQSDTVKQTSLTLPSSDYTDATKDGVTHSFEFVEWAEGDRYLLVKHHYNDAVEWLVLDREQLALEGNITKTMDIDVADAHFSGTSGHEFFVLSSGDVRKVDLSNETISRPLASNVAEF
ncbi:MAG: PEGA domain-containing protein, partial [Candidatus Saccharibacteria bacterium]